jgi:integrase
LGWGSLFVDPGVVVQLGLRFAPGACEAVGSNPTDPTRKITDPIKTGIVKTLWHIRTLAESTQKGYAKCLKILSAKVDLNDPLKTEKYILALSGTNKYKNNLFSSYQKYCISNGIDWRRPVNLRNEPYPIKIPTEERINNIISCATPKYAVVYSLSKYGLRPDEISKIRLRDFDLEKRLILVRSSKMGLSRTIQLKRETVDLLGDYLSQKGISNIEQRLFAHTKKIQYHWRRFRKAAYDKLRDPELLQIRLYDLRHWYATTTYLKTRDIFLVKYLLGHRHIQSTLIYMHVAKGLVNYTEDYTVKVASTLDEYVNLLETGFEYISDFEGMKVLRKRK